MTTNTNAASSIMELIDAYAESRHVNGAPHYNARTAEARAAVAAALASPGAADLCDRCWGSGEQQHMTQHLGPDDYEVTGPCDKCGGSGAASPGAVAAPAPTACAECNGAGEVFGHADDCTDDLCALNGDIYSCAGKVEPCQCMDSVAPIREAEGAVAAEPTLTDEHTRYLIEVKSVLPGWDEAGPAHSKLEHALEALPYYRKDTRKDLRIVRERRATVHVDSVAPPAPKE